MFDACTFAPFLEGDEQPFDHNLGGLERSSFARDTVMGRASVETTGHAFLDAIPVGKSLMEQIRSATMANLDGSKDDRHADDIFRRLTMEQTRIEQEAGQLATETHDSGRHPDAQPASVQRSQLTDGTTNRAASAKLGLIRARSKFQLNNNSAIERSHKPTDAASKSVESNSKLYQREGKLYSQRPRGRSGKQGTSGSETLDCLRGNMSHLLLYNWFLLRMDNIRILSSHNQTFNGKDDDFALLRLLAQSNADRRWWTIEVDDIACRECVGLLRARRAEIKNIGCQRYWRRYMLKHSNNVHCNGGICSITCDHRCKTDNEVSRFFQKLGAQATTRMRNILLEVPSPAPDADIIISAAHNVAYYFRDMQNLEVKFSLNGMEGDMSRDTWSRILCALVQLEACLPKGGHLRVKGIEKHTELQCGWLRKCRGWHH